MMIRSATGGLTAALLDQVDALGEPPPAVLRWARHSLIDWMGCAVAGSTDPLVRILVDELAPGEAGEAGLVGRRARTGAHAAALINGAASHALDFDDTNMAMGGHPSVPVLPAVLALGERVDASGDDVLRAVVAGMETQARIGLVVNPGHYAAGFHTTATVGTFGAAAACGRLLGLDIDERLHSLGIAGTQAAGLKAVFGTMCKPLHAGKAAANGLLAATLAARGFTSATAIIETAQGFAATHAADDGADDRLAAARGRWFTAETLYKVHAACHLTHAAIEAAGRLRTGEPVERIDVQVHPMCIGVCDIDRPRTGLEGKFSLRATVAMALLGWDTTDPATFTDERVASSDLVALRDLVTVTPSVRGSSTRAIVAVTTTDGARHEADVDVGRPASDVDAQERQLVAKCGGLVTPVLGPDRGGQLVAALQRTASARDLVALSQSE